MYEVELTARAFGRRTYRVTKGRVTWTAEHCVPRDTWQVMGPRGRVAAFGKREAEIIAACERRFAELDEDQRTPF